MHKEDSVVIVSAVRTPFGKFKGALKGFSAYELGALVIEESLKRAGFAKDQVDEVYMGCAIESENYDFVAVCVARQALLKAGLPATTISLTVDKACCSSMVAVQLAYRAIKRDPSLCIVASGAECFSRVPFIVTHELRIGLGRKMTHVAIRDPLIELGYKDFNPIARDAGINALEMGITREHQDAWALQSQQRYQEAARSGKFREELMPVTVKDGNGGERLFEADEFPKGYTTLEKLAKLPTAYGSPTVTGGNAPGLNDGASAMLLMSAKKARELGLEPLGEIAGIASAADTPKNTPIVPAVVINKLLHKAGLTLQDLDIIEINEAFAAVPLSSTKALSDGNPDKDKELQAKLNVNGGAIAIGHPLGATGCRLVMTAMYELRRRGGGLAVSSICGGLGQGEGVLLRV